MERINCANKQQRKRSINIETQLTVKKQQQNGSIALPKINNRLKTQGNILKKSRQFRDVFKRLELIGPYWSQIKKVQKQFTSAVNGYYKTKQSSVTLLQRKRYRTQIQSPVSKSLNNKNLGKIDKQKDKNQQNSIHQFQNKSIEINLITKNPYKNTQNVDTKQQQQQGSTLPKPHFCSQQRKVNSQAKNFSKKPIQLFKFQQQQNKRMRHKSSARSHPKKQTLTYKRLSQKVNKIMNSYCEKIESNQQFRNVIQNSQGSLQNGQKMTWRKKKHNQIIQAFKMLPPKRQNLNVSEIQQFICTLKLVNPIFQRVNQLTSQVLIRFLKIRALKKEDVLYYQGKPSKIVYIVLWGEFILKSMDSTFTKYAVPGDSMCQQLLFINQKQTKLKPLISASSNSFYHIQSSKALTESAVLCFTLEQFRQISKDLRKCGMKFSKDLVLIQNMMKWCYSKKYNARSYIIC